mgnify:CR=1 FL=1
MSYIDSQLIKQAITKMQQFHQDLLDVHGKFGMDFLENLGRRNCIMSQSQEQFVADELSKKYKDVRCDGRPGQPDIVVGDLDKEIECKLTTRNRSGQISFQTDYETLKSKGSLDYLYFVASDDFSEFAVLHFENLTIDNFRLPANGSRGRSQMIKSSCMKKCNIIVGDVTNNNEIHLKKLNDRKIKIVAEFHKRFHELHYRLGECSKKATKKKISIKRMIDREESRMQSNISKTNEKMKYWETSAERYSIGLELI